MTKSIFDATGEDKGIHMTVTFTQLLHREDSKKEVLEKKGDDGLRRYTR